MSQYGTLLAHANRIGAKPILSDGMKAQMKRHFPELPMKSVSEIEGCKFNWTDITLEQFNLLEISEVVSSPLNIFNSTTFQ